jgi:hypothetical protein
MGVYMKCLVFLLIAVIILYGCGTENLSVAQINNGCQEEEIDK